MLAAEYQCLYEFLQVVHRVANVVNWEGTTAEFGRIFAVISSYYLTSDTFESMQRIITFFAALIISFTALNAQGIDFQPMSLEDALISSAKSQKPVFFMAYQSTCGHCEKMMKEVFPDTAVSNFYNANFICLKVDMLDQNEAKKYIRRFYISSFPTFVILNAQGEVLSQYVGEFKAQEFLNQGQIALKPEQQLPPLRAAFEANPADSIACYKYLLALSRGRLSTQPIANTYFRANGNTLAFTTNNWKIISMSVSDIESPIFKYTLANRDSFALASSVKKVDRKLYLAAAYNMQTDISLGDTSAYFHHRDIAKTFALHTIDSLIFVNDINTYEKYKLWDRYVSTARTGAETFVWDDANMLRRIADNMLQYGNEKSAYIKGANFAVRSAELKPDYFSNLSAAKLFQKAGYSEQAKKYAQAAVDEGNKKNMNVSEATMILSQN